MSSIQPCDTPQRAASQARAERNELRESMDRALNAVAAEKEAAEQRAVKAEAALQQAVALQQAAVSSNSERTSTDALKTFQSDKLHTMGTLLHKGESPDDFGRSSKSHSLMPRSKSLPAMHLAGSVDDMALTAEDAPIMGFPEKFELCRQFVERGGLSGDSSMSDSDWLLLDSLKSQALHGPCQAPSPGYLSASSEDRTRWRAWKELGNMSNVEAMYKYTQAVEALNPMWWAWPGIRRRSSLRKARTTMCSSSGGRGTESASKSVRFSDRIEEDMPAPCDQPEAIPGDENRERSVLNGEPSDPSLQGSSEDDVDDLELPNKVTDEAQEAQDGAELHETAAKEKVQALSMFSGAADTDAPVNVPAIAPVMTPHVALSSATANAGMKELGARSAQLPDIQDLEWRIEVIMRQHAEDCKRMNPSDAARFAKQALAAVGVRESAKVDPDCSDQFADYPAALWNGSLHV